MGEPRPCLDRLPLAAELGKVTVGQPGKITAFIGPMFAGKTEALIGACRKRKYTCEDCICIKHICDTRAEDELPSSPEPRCQHCIQMDRRPRESGDVLRISSHNKSNLEAVTCAFLSELILSIRHKNYENIFIDEGWMFHDLVPFCLEMVQEGRNVYTSLLNGSYNQEMFSNVAQLIPFCDVIHHMTAICVHCGADTPFSHHLAKTDSVFDVGSKEKYIALCRKCLYEERNK